MKTKIYTALLIFALATFGFKASAQISISASVYANIPIAPHVTINVGVNTFPAPTPDYIWIDGYYSWDYRYDQYVWVEGYWALPPYRGAFWIPGYWEYTGRGYRWINSYWVSKNHPLAYGLYNGRYDYYGRPVYYHKPHKNIARGYAYAYDHNPKHRDRHYSSSAFHNDRDNKKVERPEYRSGSRNQDASRRNQDVSKQGNRPSQNKNAETNRSRENKKQDQVVRDNRNSNNKREQSSVSSRSSRTNKPENATKRENSENRTQKNSTNRERK